MDEKIRRLDENANTLLKYQQLLDAGAISQEEFEGIKDSLLNIESEETKRSTTAEEVGNGTSPSDESTAQHSKEDEDDYSKAKAVTSQQDTTPLTVRFEWVDGRLASQIYDGDKNIPYESFIKPENESTAETCKRVAEMIERDLGRPVKYIRPASESGINNNPANESQGQTKAISDSASMEQSDVKNDSKTTKKDPKSALLIALVVVIALFAFFSCVRKPNLRGAYDMCCSPLYAELASDGTYLTIDTNPHDLDDYTNSDAYEAIQNVNKVLNLPESVWSRMGSTRALDGTQTYSKDGLEVYWTYHPDHGLQVTYSAK